MNKGVWRDAKAAYKSWWSQIAMLLSAIAIFNLASRALNLELSEFMVEAVATYRAVFHPIIDFIVSPLPLRVTDWQKDLALLWLAVGGATVRTHLSELSANAFVRDSGKVTWIRVAGWVVTPFAFVSWPLFWADYFRKPYFAENDRNAYATEGQWFSRQSQVDELHSHIIADMRVVLLIQVLTVIAVVLALTAFNYVGLQ